MDWKVELAQSVRTAADLASYVGISLHELTLAEKAVSQFPVFAPRPYLDRIRKGDPSDPLLRQVWPFLREDEPQPGYSTDPLREIDSAKSTGILQKYHGRALVVTTGACAIHCRYCFRRHFPYEQSPKGMNEWRQALESVRNEPTTQELLLSGGDPLTLVDEVLEQWIRELDGIPHLRRLRIHTRLPVVIPSRVTPKLTELLGQTRLQIVVVVHFNHPAEIDDHVEKALFRLRQCGALLLNQAVLLAGVNDDVQVLAELSQRLVGLHVMPYYLNQLDRVLGASHFEVPVERGLAILERLRAVLPGYAVPRYVVETPGAASKLDVSQAAPFCT